MEKKKTPEEMALESLERVNKMSPEEFEALLKKNAAESAWHRTHGWKDPNLGTCIVCGEPVYGHKHKEHYIDAKGKPRVRYVHEGYACAGCYLTYRKCPGIVRKMTREELQNFKG